MESVFARFAVKGVLLKVCCRRCVLLIAKLQFLVWQDPEEADKENYSTSCSQLQSIFPS